MIESATLATAIAAVPGVRMVLPGLRVEAVAPALVEVRIVVRRSATSRKVAEAVAAEVREVIAAPASVRVEVAVVE